MKSIITLAVLFGTLWFANYSHRIAFGPERIQREIEHGTLGQVHVTYHNQTRPVPVGEESAFIRVNKDIAALIDRDLPLATVDSHSF